MRRYRLCHRVCWLVCALGLSGQAAATEPVRIAELSASWGPTAGMVALRDGLVALGYREDHDFFLGARFTRGDLDALEPAAEALVELGVDIIYVTGDNAARAALRATSRVPIVCLCNPVEHGFAESLARPGRNLTGVTDRSIELAPKRLEIFRELVPGLKRIVFPYHPPDLNARALLERYRAGARQLGIELLERPLANEEEARSLLDVQRGEVDGILSPELIALNIPGKVLEVAAREGIPAMFPGGTFWVERGALVTYGPEYEDSGRIAARLVDKILRGADPAAIPIERNPSIRLLLNARTAAALGVGIPPSLLLRADVVLE